MSPLLTDLERWSAATDLQRQAAAAAVAEALAADFEALGLRAFACGPYRQSVALFRHRASGLEMSLIPGGARRVYQGFLCQRDEAARRVDPFLMGRRLVWQDLWDRFGGEDQRRWRGADKPIEGVTPTAARAWLEGLGLRLPSELEWEHAAWAGSPARFPWGEALDPRYTWFDKNSGATRENALHEDAANAFGLIDAVGHVWQLCQEGFANGGGCEDHAYAFDLSLDPPPPGRWANIGLRAAASITRKAR